jgi:Catalytic LigB subunit of aromatic ring-opening dioxygenase.
MDNAYKVTDDQHTSRHEGYLIIGSGMAVHSFASIEEIVDAPTEEREATRAKVLTESRAFDTHLRAAVTKRDAKERNQALLNLETLYEFKRSHPTVEVRSIKSSRTHPRGPLTLARLVY